MKKTIGMLAVVTFASSLASAQLLKNFKYDGLLEIHKYYATNTSDYNSKVDDKINDQNYRADIGFNFDAGQNANVRIDLISSGTSNIGLGQAYVGINDLLGMSHKFGRMFYGNPGDMIIYYGPDPWYANIMSYNALEGWAGDWKKDKLNISPLIAKMIDGKGNRTDVDVYGVTANYTVNEYFNPTAYIYQGTEYNNAFGAIPPTVGMNRINILGMKADGKYMGFEYAGEYAMDTGGYTIGTAKLDYRGTAIRINAAYGFDLMGKAKVSGEYLTASGDKNPADSKDKNFYGINGNYRPGIITGSFNNPISNMTTWNLGANWTPEKLDKLNLEARFYNFGTTEKVTVGANSYDAYGDELDIAATWNYNENVAFKGYYATTMADSNYSKAVLAGNNDTAIQVGLLATAKF